MCLGGKKGIERADSDQVNSFFADYGDHKGPNYCGWFMGGGAALLILAAGALVAAYFLFPQVQTFLNHAFDQISIQKGLLFIALPSTAAGVAAGVMIHLRKHHVERMKEKLHPEGTLEELKITLKDGLRAVTPTSKKPLVAGLLILGILAALGTSLFLATYIPGVNEWVHNQAIPGVQNILNRKIALWQAALGMGGVGLTTLVATLIVLHLLQKRADADDDSGVKPEIDPLMRLHQESLILEEKRERMREEKRIERDEQLAMWKRGEL